MKKKNWRTLVATIIMVLPFVLGFGSTKDVMAAEGGSQTVTLHKRAYNGDFPNETIQNTGNEMNFGGVGLADAEFTAYDVTAAYWKAYDETSGTETEKITAAEAAAKSATLGKGITFDLTDEDGDSFKSLPTSSNGRNAVYLFKETKSPAGVIQSKSADFILGLPVYNEGTDTPKDNVHVYPKNETKTLTFEFTKYGVEEDGKSNAVLSGAEFILKDKTTSKYYSTKTGEFTETEDTASKIASDKNGKVTVTGLVLNPGSYEFYEVDSSVSTSKEQGIDSNQIFHYKKNPVVTVHVSSDMVVTYDYYDINGSTEKTTGKTDGAAAYNYKVPAPTKTVDDKDVDADQDLNFTISQEIPTDIADYSTFALVDTFNEKLVLKNTDEAKLLAEIKGSMKTLADTVTGVTIKGNTFTVAFDLTKLKEHPGETISFAVGMSVLDSAVWGGEIPNDVVFDNNFHDAKDDAVVTTYGKKFVKQDTDTSKVLENAQFVVKKGDKYLMIDANGKHSWGTSKDDAFKFTSDANGNFEVSGLAKTPEKSDPVADNGDIAYELEEVVAPDGYTLLKDTIKFTADNGVETLPVFNKHKGSLPSTGGKGIVAFVAVGVVAIAGAGLYFMKGRKHIEG